MAHSKHFGGGQSSHQEMDILPEAQSSSLDDGEVGDKYDQTFVKGHTKNDKADMSRMGKVQELRVWHAS